MPPITPCPPPTATPHGVVEFSPAAFKVGYPEFATVPDAVLDVNFGFATLVMSNGCGSLVRNPVKRSHLLNLLVAHITQLRNGANGTGASGVVGQVTSATQGSVSVSTFALPASFNQAWFGQTQWGLLWWAATASFRTMRYVPAPPVCADFPPGIGNGQRGFGC